MASKNKSSSTGSLGVFANSPLGSKLFAWLIILLVLAAVAYGGYTLIKQNSSSAASHTTRTYPLYVLYNNTSAANTIQSYYGSQFYTAFPCERDILMKKLGYKRYAIAAYVQIPTKRPAICGGNDPNIH